MKYLLLILSVLPLLGAPKNSEWQVFNLSEKKIMPLNHWKIRAGDQPEWATNPGEDSSWSPVIFWKPAPEGEKNGLFMTNHRIKVRCLGNQPAGL